MIYKKSKKLAQFKFSYLILICLIAIVQIGCSSDNGKENKASERVEIKKTTKKKKGFKTKKVKKKTDFVDLQKKVGLKKAQTDAIQRINKKYYKKTVEFQKQKMWKGPSNLKNRTSLQKAKRQELQKLLGEKYNKYINYMNNQKKK